MSNFNVPTISLNNGVEMPMIGYGTYRTSPSKTESAVAEALRLGYRLIDTAQCYGNEDGVGRALASLGLARDEVFLTTKTWTNGFDDTKRSIDRSLTDLQTDYVDLLLIHEPTSDILGIYRALEDAYREGKARAIGLSNFMGENLDAILTNAKVAPAIDQVETHPLRQQEALHEVCRENGIVMEAWSPLVAGDKGVQRDKTIAAIAEAHGKSPAQVILRWLIQRDIPVIPKSLSPEHMKQNLEVFDFSLTDEEMISIKRMDTDLSQFGWW